MTSPYFLLRVSIEGHSSSRTPNVKLFSRTSGSSCSNGAHRDHYTSLYRFMGFLDCRLCVVKTPINWTSRSLWRDGTKCGVLFCFVLTELAPFAVPATAVEISICLQFYSNQLPSGSINSLQKKRVLGLKFEVQNLSLKGEREDGGEKNTRRHLRWTLCETDDSPPHPSPKPPMLTLWS